MYVCIYIYTYIHVHQYLSALYACIYTCRLIFYFLFCFVGAPCAAAAVAVVDLVYPYCAEVRGARDEVFWPDAGHKRERHRACPTTDFFALSVFIIITVFFFVFFFFFYCLVVVILCSIYIIIYYNVRSARKRYSRLIPAHVILLLLYYYRYYYNYFVSVSTRMTAYVPTLGWVYYTLSHTHYNKRIDPRLRATPDKLLGRARTRVISWIRYARRRIICYCRDTQYCRARIKNAK